ncbi:zinc phosphodiesterase ELAC protein 2-like [Styela clava]
MTKHRKLKHAYKAILESNKIRTSQQQDPKGIATKGKISQASLEFTDTGLTLGFPSMFLSIFGSKSVQSLYTFNLNPTTAEVARRKFQHLSAIFFTRCSYQAQGGAITPILSTKKVNNLYDAGTLPCYGPKGLYKSIRKLYSYLLSPLIRERFFARVPIYEKESEFTDDNIYVKKIFLNPEFAGEDTDVHFRHPTSCYICQIKNFPMVVNVEEYNRVRQSVTDIDNLVNVELEKVSKPMKPYTPIIILIDCPTPEHFKSLSENLELENYFATTGSMTPSLVAHITPENILTSQEYQNWIKKFGQSCNHIILSEKNKPYYDGTKCEQILTFNKISSQMFPSVQQKYFARQKQDNIEMLEARYGLRFTMQYGNGNFKFDDVICEEKFKEISTEVEEVFKPENDVIRKVQQEIGILRDIGDEHYFPRIVVLGSGSMKDHEKRCQPAFLFMINKDCSIILDSGVHTLMQLYVNFGDKTEDVLSTIKLIFISHKHLDHVSGFFTLLDKIVRVRQKRNISEKVICLTPLHLGLFFEEYSREYEPNIYENTEFFAVEDVWNKSKLDLNFLINVQKTVGVKHLMPIPVNHSIQTYGISIVTQCGKKILYTSDTLPMARHVIQQGKNVDLLIHDCLYVHDDWEMDARIRKHSYLSGVIDTAEATNAKFTLLTHFSPILPMLPVLNLPSEYKDKMACAFDNLSISLHDLPKLTKLEPALRAVYRESLEKFEERLVMQRFKRNRFKEEVQNLVDII